MENSISNMEVNGGSKLEDCESDGNYPIERASNLGRLLAMNHNE